MSFEGEERYSDVARALASVGLEAVIVGAGAGVLQGSPLSTFDVDLLVRRTKSNEKKIEKLRTAHPGSSRVELLPDVHALSLPGLPPIDLIFDAMPPALTFASVKSRATKMTLGGRPVLVASLEDVIRSKAAADRPKDRVHLVTLRETLAVKRKLGR